MNYKQSKETYEKYINEHKANVKKAWDIFQERLYGYKYMQYDFIRHIIDYNINHHDDSKFNINEFEAYRNKWYPANGEKIRDDNYAKAWNHHKAVNLHHWEHWYDTSTKTFEQAQYGIAEKFTYLVEMLCDWIAMGINGDKSNALEWYNANKDIIRLEDYDRTLVEEMLEKFYGGE